MAITARASMATLLVLLLGACASQPDARDGKDCPEEKADACTMDYSPVIGYDADGKDQGVFSNHCNACQEDNVDYTVPKEDAE